MNYNPYAAPQGQPPPQPVAAGGGMPQAWDVGEVYGQALEAFKRDWAVLVMSWFLLSIILGVPMQIGSILLSPVKFGETMRPDQIGSFYAALSPIYVVALGAHAFFDVGLIRMQCASARGETPNFATLFSGGSKFLPLLGAKLLMGLLLGTASICLVIPGIIGFVALWPVDYFIVDADQDIGTAFKSAWTSTRGQWLSMFLFFLVGLGVYFLGFVACCIGVLATYPLYRVAKAILYQRISGRGPGAAAPYGQYPQAPPVYGAPGAGYGPPGGGYGGPPPGGGGYGGPPGGGYGPPQGGGGYGGPQGGGGYGGPPPGGGGPQGGGWGPPQ